MKEYNKLVRHRIPDIILESNRGCNATIVSMNELKTYLKAKAIEESHELNDAITSEEILEELADLYDVVKNIMKVYKISITEVETLIEAKSIKRGHLVRVNKAGYFEGVVLERADDRL